MKGNRGAAGVDAQTIADFEPYGVERFLEELGVELQAGKYRPACLGVKRSLSLLLAILSL